MRWPPVGDSLPNDNAASLVLEVGTGAGRVLLAADVDSTREGLLGVEGPLAVLKVAHHGSGSSSGDGFLARARPSLAVVTCGRRNVFGHPDRGALSRLAASGAGIARSDREGAVWLELSATGARRLDWRRGEPRPGARSGSSTGPTAPGLARTGPRW